MVINLMWFIRIFVFFFYRINSEEYKNVLICMDRGNDSKCKINFMKLLEKCWFMYRNLLVMMVNKNLIWESIK